MVHVLLTKCMLICSILSVLPFASTLVLNDNVSNKITLTVFYETLCPYSMRFFTEQLATLFNNDTQLYRYVNFDLVPFGNAQVRRDGENLEFSCQHGVEECAYNKLHACITTGISIINASQINRIYVPFLICLMSTTDEESVLKQCTERYEVPIDWLKHCQYGKTGAKLLAKLGVRTKQFTPKIKYVPTIVINGEYNENDEQLAETNLLKLVCKHLRPKPNTCNLV